MPDKRRDYVARGDYSSSPFGTTLFLSLRILDGFVLQRALQVLDPIPMLLHTLGLTVPPAPPSGGPPLAMSDHALTPYQAVVWAMSIAVSLKSCVWVLYTSKEAMLPRNAVIIGLGNAVGNSLNTLAFGLASVNPTWSEALFRVATPLFVVGLLVELVSEVQRKWFKDDPRNAGKPYSGGLFGYARSINYFGFTVWRGAFAMAAAGWVWGLFIAVMSAREFVSRAIPILDEYCTKKYGVQWEELKKRVPYAFCPGVY